MPLERSSISQVVQIGAEATAGTRVNATKRLSALSVSLSPVAETQQYRPQGQLARSTVAIGKYSASGSLAGPATFDEIVYPLSSVIRSVTPTTPGGATDAREWLYNFPYLGGVSYKTYTIQQGSKQRAHEATNCAFTEFGLTFNRSQVQVSGALIGKGFTDDVRLNTNAKYTLTANATPPSNGTFSLTVGGQTASGIAYDATAATVQTALEGLSTVGTGNVLVTANAANTGSGKLSVGNNVYTVEFINDMGQQAVTLTGTFTTLTASGSIALASSQAGAAPTTLALKPSLPKQWNVFMDEAHGNLGTTKLTRVLSGSFNISNRYGPLWTVNSSEASWTALVELEPTLEAKLMMEMDDEGGAMLERLQDGATRFFRYSAGGDNIESGQPYLLQYDFAAQVSNIGQFTDSDGVYAVEFTLTPVFDSTWGKVLEILVRNSITAL